MGRRNKAINEPRDVEVVRKGGRDELEKTISESEAQMNAYLTSLQLVRKRIPRDGACLFRAVAEHVYFSQTEHLRVRRQCVSFMQTYATEFEPFVDDISFEEYLDDIMKPSSWGGELEIRAMSKLYGIEFRIYTNPDLPPKIYTSHKGEHVICEIYLVYDQENHYDLAYSVATMESLEICQAIICNTVSLATQEPTDSNIACKYRNIDWDIWVSGERELAQRDRRMAKQIAETREKKLSYYKSPAVKNIVNPAESQEVSDRKFAEELQRAFNEENSIKPKDGDTERWQPASRGRRSGRGSDKMNRPSNRAEERANVEKRAKGKRNGVRGGRQSSDSVQGRKAPNISDRDMFPDMANPVNSKKSDTATSAAWSSIVARGTDTKPENVEEHEEVNVREDTEKLGKDDDNHGEPHENISSVNDTLAFNPSLPTGETEAVGADIIFGNFGSDETNGAKPVQNEGESPVENVVQIEENESGVQTEAPPFVNFSEMGQEMVSPAMSNMDVPPPYLHQYPVMPPPYYQMTIDPNMAMMYGFGDGYVHGGYQMAPPAWPMSDPSAMSMTPPQQGIEYPAPAMGFNQNNQMIPPPPRPTGLTPDALYKTKLCISFVHNGSCHLAAACKFAHGVSELRGVDPSLIRQHRGNIHYQQGQVCYQCQERGHVQRDCPNLPRNVSATTSTSEKNEESDKPQETEKATEVTESSVDVEPTNEEKVNNASHSIPPMFQSKRPFMGLCFICHQPGHVARFCPNARVCARCGVGGHDAANCPVGQQMSVPLYQPIQYPSFPMGMMPPNFVPPPTQPAQWPHEGQS